MVDLINKVFLKIASVPTEFDWSLHLENVDIGIMITVLGIFVVFAVLIIISLLLSIFAMLAKDRKKSVSNPKPATGTPSPVIPVKTSDSGEKEDTMDDKELVAVITAAIAASMGTGTDKFIVRRIRRTGSWNKEAIEEQQYGLY